MPETTPAKPMWRRHTNACNQRVFNDPIDWEGHLRACPYDINVKLKKLTDAIDKLNIAERLEALESELPTADPYAVEDGDADTGSDSDFDDAPAEDDLDPLAPAARSATSYYDDPVR